jgi:hypothetical protein
MTWAHLLDATIFIVGTLVGFAAAVWVEARSTAYARDFDRRYWRNWDHRAARFDEHCRSAGVRDRRNMLPGRWSS